MSIAAILLAAGESTRMGRLKQLLDWDGLPLVAWQCRQLRDAGTEEVVVVLGHAAEEIAPHVPTPARVAVNADYKHGRATSLKRGAEALPDSTDAVLVLSVDQPRPAWLSRRLIQGWAEARAPQAKGSAAAEKQPLVVSPRFVRGFGHPILLDGSLLQELREVDEETLGLRAVIDRHVDAAIAVKIENENINVDLNKPSDYEIANRNFADGYWNEDVKTSSI